MQISHGTKIKNINDTNGYGYATTRMIESLTRLGHEVNQNDPTAPVQIWFDQPHHWKWNDSNQYRIGYHPWESTKLLDGWLEKFNEVDEIWTPSPLIAEWYRKLDIKPPVYVYEHGVDAIWSEVNRTVEDRVKFLHLGAEAARKGGIEVLRKSREVFKRQDDGELTLKMINPGMNMPTLGRSTIINKRLDLNQMVDLFHSHHVYIYPSWGEGFGLTPLQAMATGMPTITVPAWAPYARFLDPRLSLRSRLVESPWQELHPGKMFMPSTGDMAKAMRWVVDNYDEAQDFAHAQVAGIRAYYNWDLLTEKTFSALADRLENK